jgi:hypothetical protein
MTWLPDRARVGLHAPDDAMAAARGDELCGQIARAPRGRAGRPLARSHLPRGLFCFWTNEQSTAAARSIAPSISRFRSTFGGAVTPRPKAATDEPSDTPLRSSSVPRRRLVIGHEAGKSFTTAGADAHRRGLADGAPAGLAPGSPRPAPRIMCRWPEEEMRALRLPGDSDGEILRVP